MSTRSVTTFLLALAALLLVAPSAVAEWQDEDDGIRQSVARLSWFEGDVSFNRGDDPDEWQLAAVNYPLTLGDRLWAGRGSRAELQLRGATVFLAPESELGLLDLSWDDRLLSLTWGTATFRVLALDRDDVFEVATPNASVVFDAPGLYRIDVDDEGNSRVAVSQGRAWAAAAGGQVLLERGERMRVWGLERPEYDVVRIGRTDSWDRWVERRVRRFRSVRSSAFVHPDVCGLDDLDAWGSWAEHADWGFVWYPRTTVAGWTPYRAGRWIWRDPWGWTWLSSEPWGWAPYHHGRWILVRGRWAWVPEGPRGRSPGWYPAVVAFFGGGRGWEASLSAAGYVGWFPLGPGEPLHPWWRRSRRHADAPPFRYVHRDRGVVVTRDVFARGHWGDRDVVRDPRVLREISGAPILRGPIPAVPSRDAIRTPRGPVGTRDAAAPPRRAAERPVVTRRTVPSAPPAFERQVEAVRERGGEPVPVEEWRRMSSQEPRGERPVAPVRPVTRDEVGLAPRGTVEPSRRPQAIPPTKPRQDGGDTRPTAAPVEPVPTRPVRRAEEVFRPTAAPAEPTPTRPARRSGDELRPTPEPRTAATPPPRRVDVPEPRPTWPAEPTPTRAAEPTPTPRPRRGTFPTEVPRTEERPTAAPPPPTAPARAPRAEATPTPEQSAVPAEPRRRIEGASPAASPVPREEVRTRPREAEGGVKGTEGPSDQPAVEGTPTAVPRRRVTPGPG